MLSLYNHSQIKGWYYLCTDLLWHQEIQLALWSAAVRACIGVQICHRKYCLQETMVTVNQFVIHSTAVLLCLSMALYLNCWIWLVVWFSNKQNNCSGMWNHYMQYSIEGSYIYLSRYLEISHTCDFTYLYTDIMQVSLSLLTIYLGYKPNF